MLTAVATCRQQGRNVLDYRVLSARLPESVCLIR
jgi:hypothetical protein